MIDFKSFWNEESLKLNDADKSRIENDFGETDYFVKWLLAKVLSANPSDNVLDAYEAFVEENKYLFTAKMSPREFGETWAEGFVLEKNPNLKKSGVSEYDLTNKAEDVRIEVKAKRVATPSGGGSMADRMKKFEDTDDEKYKLNFQQVKPLCCDYFILMAVYLDRVRAWLVPSIDVLDKSKFSFSRQHRGGDGTEGQLWITPSKLSKYECNVEDIQNLL